MAPAQREGVLVTPHCRLSDGQVRQIDGISRRLLEGPGLRCASPPILERFAAAGAAVEDLPGGARVRLPSAVVDRALGTAPSQVVLGARNPDHRLVLDAHEARVRFGTGSETNTWLDMRYEGTSPQFTRQKGTIAHLARSAHLAEHLESCDFFVRNVNIQDPEINPANKDVNQFLTSLSHTTKHVQAGLESVYALDDLVRMGRLVAGGEAAFEGNPVFSLITCVIKSPLQVVSETAEKLVEIARRRVPVVISCAPMGGTTGAFEELALVAQINAEILAGVTLQQLAAPGSPVLYGAVPLRTRLDNLNDMYAAPERLHYSLDCAQMARHYGLPCYAAAGEGDSPLPGIQATLEKMLSIMSVARGGAQYLHNAFGLLDRTRVFCPEQAILDDVQIDLVKRAIGDAWIGPERGEDVVSLVDEVMLSSHKTFMYHLPLPTRDRVYARYPLEGPTGDPLQAAHERYQAILAQPPALLPPEVRTAIVDATPGLLPQTIAACRPFSGVDKLAG